MLLTATDSPHILARRNPLRWAAAGVGITAAVLILIDVPGPLRVAVVLLAWLAVPGWALMRWVEVKDPAARLALTAITSVAITILVSVLMVWTTLWHPRLVPAAILILSAGSLALWPSPRDRVARLRAAAHRPAVTRTATVQWILLTASVTTWAAALAVTNTDALGSWGLLPALPVAWYAAVATTLVLCLWGILSATRSSPLRLSASVATLVVMLYGSANILAAEPRLPWVFKHIAVTRLIDATGAVDPGIDLYNRWPGFFSASALIGEIIGHTNPLDYAAWSEVGFSLVNTVLVLAIARSISKNHAFSWTVALTFVLGNWVGQTYYSPQTLAYTLYLTLCLVMLQFLRGAPWRWVARIEDILARRRRTDHSIRVPDEWTSTAPAAGRRYVIAAVVVLQFLIVATHQLSPYIAILVLLPVCLLGFFRPSWLGFALLGLALAYLLPNLGYVQSNYGLFSGGDPVANATYTPNAPMVITAAAAWQSDAVRILTLLILVLAAAGFIRHALQGQLRITIVVVWLALAPALTLFAQSYGGEGRFRIFLFGLPWYAMGVAWLFWSGRSRNPRLRRTVTAAFSAAMALFAALFVGTYYQPEASLVTDKNVVAGAEWTDSHLVPGDSVMSATDYFPFLIGPNYPILMTSSGSFIALSDVDDYYDNAMDAADIKDVAYGISPHGRTFLVFFPGTPRDTKKPGYPTVEELAEMEQAIASEYDRVFEDGSVRIYVIP